MFSLAPLRPLWLDEVLQLSDTFHNNLHQTTDRVAHNPGGVPLPYVVQNLFVNAIGHPFYSARALAVLWAIAAMASFVWLTRLLHTSWLPAALSFALMPIALRYALEVRQYGPALAFVILATALLVYLDRQPSVWHAALYALALTCGIHSHPYVGFALLAHVIWAFRRPGARYVYSACALAILAFVPWFLFAHTYWFQAVSKGGYESNFTWRTPLMIPHELSGGGYFLTCAVLALAIYGYRESAIDSSAKKLLAFCILTPLPLVMAANLLFRYFFAIRQLIFILPPLCILSAEGLRALPRVPRAAVATFLLAIALGCDIHWFFKSF
jgi:4-amino-4-deoxy-L-arabinose transferase-like glycosyltransferase